MNWIDILGILGAVMVLYVVGSLRVLKHMSEESSFFSENLRVCAAPGSR